MAENQGDIHFHPDHLKHARKSGLSDNTIRENKIYSVVPADINKELGVNFPSVESVMAIPFRHADGFKRFRLFPDSESHPRYYQKTDSGNHLYLPAGIEPILKDPSIALHIVEGELKAMRGFQEGLLCIALTGLWNWSKGKNELVNDFDLIELDNRKILIVPDSDWKGKSTYKNKKGKSPSLKLAVQRLAERLRARGATVFVKEIPADGADKVGLDDYLIRHTSDEFRNLPESEIKPPRKDGDKDKKTQAETALEFSAGEIVLFHDRNKDPFAFFKGKCLPLRSKDIRSWIAFQNYLQTGKTLNSDAENQVLKVMEGKAIFEAAEEDVRNRVASKDGAFWFDMGDHRAIRITPTGWTIQDAPILFRRYAHQQAQVDPLPGGDPWKVFKFINVTPSNQLIVLIYIASAFIPDIPRVIVHAHGPQGSGKSTFFRVIKKLTDPSSIEILIRPRDRSELIQVLSHHHVCLFDNLYELPDWMPDILAQAATGSGISKRALYTDDDDHIYTLLRSIGLNGINLVIDKADLMDRALLLFIERIEESRRKKEADLWAEFENERPSILGGLVDGISKAMAIYPGVKLPFLFRMADFTAWGYALAEAFSRSGDEFLDCYRRNVEQQTDEVIQGNTLAQAVIAFMDDKSEWDGTVKQAFELLLETAKPEKRDHSFPKDPKNLGRHLERIKITLLDIGISYTIGKRTGGGYPILFQKTVKPSSSSSLSTLPSELLKNFDEHNDELNLRPNLSSLTSSSDNTLKSLQNELDERNEHDFQTSWEGVKSECDDSDLPDDIDLSFPAGEVLDLRGKVTGVST
jgi:energy-coupling factor transporter ATP-binding protein EcfA2